MNFLHVTDLHFCKVWFEWIFLHQQKFSAICISGDLLDDFSDVDLEEQKSFILSWSKRIKTPLFICSGNHDEAGYGKGWIYKLNANVDGQIVNFKGIKIGCMPYIAPDFSDFWECDVILTHVPPSKTLTSTHRLKDEDWGDEELRNALLYGTIKPKILLCGHIHKPKSTTDTIKNTKIYNPGFDKNSLIPQHFTVSM